MQNNVRRARITIEAGAGSTLHYTRWVQDARPTGFVTATWGGSPKYQWAGHIRLGGKIQKVWGYADLPQEIPQDWSNDTY